MIGGPAAQGGARWRGVSETTTRDIQVTIHGKYIGAMPVEFATRWLRWSGL